MPTERRCEKCGTVLTPFGAEALCPSCMLREAIGLQADLTAQPPAAGGPTPPSAEALADRKSSNVNPKVRYFGDYELLEEIAHGGMGVVYKARQTSLNRIIALKMILSGPYASREFIQRFRAEAEAVAKLQHPNVVAIHEVGEHEGHHYFSMDYVEGRNLAELVRDKPLSAQRAAACVKIIAEAIHYAHQQGILHRDLKPSNVLIDQFDRPRVTDFGLAKRLNVGQASGLPPAGFQYATNVRNTVGEMLAKAGETPGLLSSDLTATGQVLGTPNYMPPEQASGKRGEIGPHSDVYSLGAILYYLITARPPFFAETFEETLFQVLNADVSSPRLLNASISRDLETICLKCLEKQPAKRYSTAQALADELNRFLLDEPIQARPVSRGEQVWRWARRKPALAATSFAAIALMLAVAIGSPIAVFRINQARRVVEQNLFVADMKLAFDGMESSNHERARGLLERHRHQTNLLGFDWRYLWRQTRSQEAHQFRGHARQVRTVAFSPDGQSLASRSTDGVLKLWNLPTSRERFSVTNVVALGGFATGGTNLIVATGDGSVCFIDFMTAREIGSRRLPEPVALLLGGGRFALGRESDERAVVRDVGTSAAILRLTLLAEFWGEQAHRTWIAISSDGRTLAVQSARRIEGTSPSGMVAIDLWDLTRGHSITNLIYDGSELGALALSPDGTMLVAGGLDGTLTFWDLTTFRLTQRVALHEATVQELAFSPDGKLLASCSADQTIVLWDLDAKQAVANFVGHGGLVATIAFSPDGQLLASGNLDGTVRLWDAEYRNPLDTAPAGIGNQTRLVFSRDSKNLIAGCTDSSCKMFDVQTLEPTLVLTGVDFAVGLDTKGHAILNGDQRVVLWDFQNGGSHEVPMQNIVSNRYGVYAVSRSGKLSAWTSWLDLVQLWDNSAWKEIARLRISVPGFGNGLCFLPDERTLAITCRDGEIVIWNWTSGSAKTFKTGLDEPLVITISADGKLLACEEAESRIRVWSLPGGEEVAVLKGHRQYIHDLAFAPDGKTLASCSNDGTVRLWNVQLAQETAILRVVPARTKGTNIRVWSLAFSPDGNTLAAYAGNGRLKVWRAASWEEILQEERQAQTAGLAKRQAVSQPR